MNYTPEELYEKAVLLRHRLSPEEETEISKSSLSSYHYARDVIKGRWPELEEAILKRRHLHFGGLYIFLYARDIIKGRWLEGEAKIILAEDSWQSFLYAKSVIKGRWPEAEKMIKEQGIHWKDYKDHFKQEFELEEILNS